MQSPSGWREAPCSECGRFVAGLALGERCADCLAMRTRRASRMARLTALIGAALTTAWVVLGGSIEIMRWWSIPVIGVTYALVHTIARRIAMEVLP